MQSKVVPGQDDEFSSSITEISSLHANPKKKMQVIEQYDRTTDPYDHNTMYD